MDRQKQSRPTRTRFAPSPTGELHLGHAFAAQYAMQFASSNNGECLLRFEDIDTTRVRENFYQQIVEDLAYLGLAYPKPHLCQTSRSAAYLSSIEMLKAKKLIYPCFCTRKQIERELAHITNAPHGPEGAHYPGTCRDISESEINERLSSGEIPALRLHSQRAKEMFPDLTFHDSIHGTVKVDHTLLGDVILSRKDIGTSYHVAVVVDDAYQNITDVTRGEDLLHSTHIHRILQAALDLPEPQSHHHKLIVDENGNRLAKRHDSLSLRALREQGMTAEEILQKIR